MISIVVINDTEPLKQEFNMADYQYMRIINQIKDYGKWDKNPRPRWDDDTPAFRKSIFNARMQFNYGRNKDEMPMLTTKKVAQKDPIKELLWIWRDKSNKVQDLQDVGCTVWDKWVLPDGTIGKSYGWQLRHNRRKVEVTEDLIEMIEDGRLAYGRHFDDVHYVARNLRKDMNDRPYNSFVIFIDQVDFILYKLATDPYSTRLKTSLWGVEDLDDMALEPCVYDTHFQYDGDELHLTVNIRSNDMALGNPYNVFQYSVLHHMIAQISNMAVGTITFNIDNAHYYDRHIDGLEEQMKNPMKKAPTLKLNKSIKSFYDFTIDDVTIEGYDKDTPKIKFEVAE